MQAVGENMRNIIASSTAASNPREGCGGWGGGDSLSGMNASSGFELSGLVTWVLGVMCICLSLSPAAQFSNWSFKVLTHSAPGLNQRTIVGDGRSSEGAPRAFRTCVGLGKVCTRSSAAFCVVFPNTAAVPATTSGCWTDTRCSESCPDCFPSSIRDQWANNFSCDVDSSSVYIRSLAPIGCSVIEWTQRSWWNSDVQVFV